MQMQRYKITLFMMFCSSITDESYVVDAVGFCFASASLITICRPKAKKRQVDSLNNKIGLENSFLANLRTFINRIF